MWDLDCDRLNGRILLHCADFIQNRRVFPCNKNQISDLVQLHMTMHYTNQTYGCVYLEMPGDGKSVRW